MTVNHPAALLRRLNPFCAHALEAAASLCQTRAHAEITIEHLLLKLLEQGEGDLTVISRRYEWDLDVPGSRCWRIWRPSALCSYSPALI
jgi:type VI secretion system protein VasG